MSPEKQRIAIAEACGFVEVEHDLVWSFGSVRFRFCDLPDYLNDLNAMHEAENVLSIEDCDEYMFRLQLLTFKRDGYWGFCHATAAQRAQAFLRAIGKWEDYK